MDGLTITLSSIRKGQSFGLSCCLVWLAGLLAGLAPEPVKAWPLIWVALVPLWVISVTIPQINWKVYLRIGLLGALWGLGYYGVTLMWITGLHPLTWMGVPWLASVAIALFAWSMVTVWGMVWSALWASLFIGLTNKIINSSFGTHHLSLKQASLRVLIGTALWCSIDWVWSQGFLYWPSLAFTQSPNNLWILQLNQWSGPTTVTASIVAVNGFIAESVLMWQAAKEQRIQFSEQILNATGHRRIARPKSSHRISGSQLCGAIALCIFTLLHIVGGILFFQPIASSNQDSLKIGIIQGNIPTRIKLFDEGLRRALLGYSDGYMGLVQRGADAVLTPEGALPIFWRSPVNTRTPIYQAVLEKNIPLWLGTFVPQGRDFTQSMITLDQSGEVVSQYNKVKLVPLGEYIPFSSVLGSLVDRLSPLDAYMIPGTIDQIVDTPLGQTIFGICYESAFAELFRVQAKNGGEFILTASNNDPYNTVMMAQHHAQDVMRAIETDRWAVRATNTGYSGVVDPHGRTVWRSPANVYFTYIATINRRKTETIYVRFGDWLTPTLIATSIIFAATIFPRNVSGGSSLSHGNSTEYS